MILIIGARIHAGKMRFGRTQSQVYQKFFTSLFNSNRMTWVEPQIKQLWTRDEIFKNQITSKQIMSLCKEIKQLLHCKSLKLNTENLFKWRKRFSFAVVCATRNLLNSLVLLTTNGWIFVYSFYRWFQRSSRCGETRQLKTTSSLEKLLH